MPPRIPQLRNQPLGDLLEHGVLEAPSGVLSQRRPSRSSRCMIPPPSSCNRQQSSSFSTTAPTFRPTRLRQQMWSWLNSKGAELKETTGKPKYLEQNRPFPLNPAFVSQPVLSEQAREMIWRDVIVEGKAIKATSAKYGVDIRRVAAVVRMKEIEKTWEKEGKQLAVPYAKAVMGMLPQTTYDKDGDAKPHEPVNEIHVHSYTMQQLFVPTSESRHFTRADAAKAFGEHIKSADKRVPVPELVQLERNIHEGMEQGEAVRAFTDAVHQSEAALAQKNADLQASREAKMKRVGTDRFEFRYQDFNSDKVGKDGRKRDAVGWKYGFPHPDRKRGQVKIPTRVE